MSITTADKRMGYEIGVHAGNEAYNTFFNLTNNCPPQARLYAMMIGLAYMAWKHKMAISMVDDLAPEMADTINKLQALFSDQFAEQEKNGTSNGN